MLVEFTPIKYADLNSRQKEAYNFQKVSALLAEFGYSTIRLTDDWNGADFIAQNNDGKTFLKVQLKGRLCFYEKYSDKELYLCFRDGENWYFYPHDELRNKVLDLGLMKGSTSWDEKEGYSFPHLSKQLKELLKPYLIPSEIHAD
jgi:hypothetical protein